MHAACVCALYVHEIEPMTCVLSVCYCCCLSQSAMPRTPSEKKYRKSGKILFLCLDLYVVDVVEFTGHCCTAVHRKEGIKWRGHTIRKQHYIIIFIFLQRMGFSLVNCAMCLRAPIPDVVVLSHCEAIILRFCFAMLRIHFPTHLMRLSVDNVDKYWLIWNLACCIVCLVRFQFPTRTIDDTNYHCKY